MTKAERSIRIIGRTADVLDRTSGLSGEIFLDATNQTLRLFDGTTPGGVVIGGSGGGGGGLTTEQVQDIAAAMLNGSHTGITVAYNDPTGKITLTGFNGSYNSLTNKPTLFDGNYNSLTNKPSLFSGAYTDLSGKPTLFSGAYADLTGKPTLFSGNYDDLNNKPQIPSLVGYATETYVGTQITNVIGTAGAALNTLGELSDALNDDANFAGTVTTALAAKAPIANPTFTGTVAGITATMVGLGNVTNESKATMFSSPTFTGTTIATETVGFGSGMSASILSTIGGGAVALNVIGSISNTGRYLTYSGPDMGGNPFGTFAWSFGKDFAGNDFTFFNGSTNNTSLSINSATDTVTVNSLAVTGTATVPSLVNSGPYKNLVTLEANVTQGDPVSFNQTNGTYGPSNHVIEAILQESALYNPGDYTDSGLLGVVSKVNDPTKFMVIDRKVIRAGSISGSTVTITPPLTPGWNPNGQSWFEGTYFDRRTGYYCAVKWGLVGQGDVVLYAFNTDYINAPTQATSTTISTVSYPTKFLYSYNAGILFQINGSGNIQAGWYHNGATFVQNSNVQASIGFVPKLIWDSPTDPTKFKFVSDSQYVEVTFASSTETISFGTTVSSSISWYEKDTTFDRNQNFGPDIQYITGSRSSDNATVIASYSDMVVPAAVMPDENTLLELIALDESQDASQGQYTLSTPSPVIALAASGQYIIPWTRANWNNQSIGSLAELALVHVNSLTNTTQVVGRFKLADNTADNVTYNYDYTNNNLIVVYNSYTPDYKESINVSVLNLGTKARMPYPAENFIGLAQTTTSASGQVQVTTANSISNVHTGLTPGRNYYISSSGLSTSKAVYSNPSFYQSNYVGRAISATEILVGRSPVLLGRNDIGYSVASNATGINRALTETFSYNTANQTINFASITTNSFEYLVEQNAHRTAFTGSGFVNNPTSYTLPGGLSWGTVEIFNQAASGGSLQHTVVNYIKNPGVNASYTVVSNNIIGSSIITVTGLTSAGVLSFSRAQTGYAYFTIKYSTFN